jgi:hypothetical protein
MNGSGGGGHAVGDGRQLLGGGLGLGDEPGDHLRAGRQQQHATHDGGQRVQPEPEPGGHPEVAATTPDRPEQVGMVLGVHLQQLAVGGDQLGGQQVVDGQAVLSDQVADPAAQGDPADPHRAGVAEPGRQPIGRGGGAVLPAVSPVWAQALRWSGSMSSARRSPRSSTIPPSVVLCPTPLCPPLRTASSTPVSRASSTTRETSVASAARTIAAAGGPPGRRCSGQVSFGGGCCG